MPRSTLAFAFSALLVGVACAKSSDNPPVVTAPVASTPAQATAGGSPTLPVVADAGGAGTGSPANPPAADPGDAGLAAFQACQTDSDCVAVPKVGCCHNGYKEAVNVTQKDAYQASFTCQIRPMCPMFIIRDRGIPQCDSATHLCKLVQPQP
jgi:hypothetical protein